jgi:hypothetical protein
MKLSMERFRVALIVLVVMAAGASTPMAQSGPGMHAPLDRLVDKYVRDGYVYYNAVKSERATLDRYIASLDLSPDQLDRMTENDRRAFWINAYNALVLRTVINAYPIRGKSPAYPPSSVGQIPGAFDRVKHRVGGKVLTLDEIENHIASWGDARMLLALGRGTVGSGRLRSEAYQGGRLEEQLNDAVKGFVRTARSFRLDRDTGSLTVTPLFSWRGQHFIASFASGKDAETWANRTPLERAIVAMAFPHLFPSERAILALNTFQMSYSEFDWRLNDLTGGIPE